MALIKRLDWVSAKKRRNKCKHSNSAATKKNRRTGQAKSNQSNLFTLNSNQLISDQFLIKNPNYADLSKPNQLSAPFCNLQALNGHNFSGPFNEDGRFASANSQFCPCCFLDKHSTTSGSRDSSSSPKSTVTHISNNQLFSDQLSDRNSQTSSEGSNLWCSTPSSSNDLQSTNVSTESFVLDDKLNTNLVTGNSYNTNSSTQSTSDQTRSTQQPTVSNFLNVPASTNSTPNRITPTFRSFNQVHQQASKQYQTNQLNIDDNFNSSFNSKTSSDRHSHHHSDACNFHQHEDADQTDPPKSCSQSYGPYPHSFANHLLNHLNYPNQHLLFVNRLIAQNNNCSDQEQPPFESQPKPANLLPQLKAELNGSFRLPHTLAAGTRYQKRQFKSNSKSRAIEKQPKTPFVSRIVAKIKANKFRLAMYRNSSTSTSLQSQSTLHPHGSFHKPGSNVALCWQDINVYKPIPIVDQLAFRLNTNVLGCEEHNLILKQLNGFIKFGEIMAIMGPSGAGKSTLLKCLFGTANVKYDGKLFVQNKQIKAVFITQNELDHLLMNLTVEEAIYYSSNLKMNKSAENDKIEQLIEQLELTNCRSTLVKSCSGGQKKRIAIAQELVGSIKPRLLFLDEPTSGLDSNVSFVVLSQLQKLCRTHHIAIVATIHQPSFKLVELFDQLYIISKGGKCVFFGKPRNLKGHLKEFQVKCPEGHNPADIAIDYAAINTRITKEDLIQNKLLEKLASSSSNEKKKSRNKKKFSDLEAASLDKENDEEFDEDSELAICKIDGRSCTSKHDRETCSQRINNLDQCCNNFCCCTCCATSKVRDASPTAKCGELIQFPPHPDFYIGKTPINTQISLNDKSQMIVNMDQANAFGENKYSNNLMGFDNLDAFYLNGNGSNSNSVIANARYSANSTYDALRAFKLNQYAAERSASKHLSVLSNNSTTSTQESKKQTVRAIEQAMEKNCRSQVNEIKSQVKSGSPYRLREIQKLCENRNSFLFRHTWSLFKRTFTNSILREPKWLVIRIGLHCLVAIVLFSLYDDSIGKEDGCLILDQNGKLPSYMFTRDLSSLRNEDLTAKNVSFLFFNLLFLMFAALMPTVLTFPTEIKVFLNEHRNGWYSTCSYYWAKTITELLIQLPLPYFYCLFMYWSTKQFGLNQLDEALPWSTVPSRFREFAFICVMASFIAQGMGFLIGALFTTNFNISIFVATIVMLFNFLFSGFFVKIKDMGEAALITNLSFIRFSFESIMLSIYGFDRCDMYKTMDMTEILKMKNININQTEISTELASYNQMKAQNAELMKIFPVENKVVQAVLYRFEIGDSDFNLDIYGLFGHLLLWRLLTYVVLFIKANPSAPFSNLFLKLTKFQELTLKFIKWFCIIQIICFVIGIIIIIIQLNV